MAHKKWQPIQAYITGLKQDPPDIHYSIPRQWQTHCLVLCGYLQTRVN